VPKARTRSAALPLVLQPDPCFASASGDGCAGSDRPSQRNDVAEGDESRIDRSVDRQLSHLQTVVDVIGLSRPFAAGFNLQCRAPSSFQDLRRRAARQAAWTKLVQFFQHGVGSSARGRDDAGGTLGASGQVLRHAPGIPDLGTDPIRGNAEFPNNDRRDRRPDALTHFVSADLYDDIAISCGGQADNLRDD